MERPKRIIVPTLKVREASESENESSRRKNKSLSLVGDGTSDSCESHEPSEPHPELTTETLPPMSLTPNHPPPLSISSSSPKLSAPMVSKRSPDEAKMGRRLL